MNEALDTALVGIEDEKPSKPYRTSPYTVRQYCSLPHAQRLVVDAECDALAGLVFTTHEDEQTEKPYTVGRAIQKLKGAQKAPFKSAQPAQLKFLDSITSEPLAVMTATTAPMPTTMDNLLTPSIEGSRYSIVAVAGHYVNLISYEDNAAWTHHGYSPFLGGDDDSFVVNERTGAYQCFLSNKTGTAVELVLFMEEEEVSNEAEALAWLAANIPGALKAEPTAESDEIPASGLFEVSEPLVEASDAEDSRSLAGFNELAANMTHLTSPESVSAVAPEPTEETVYQTTDYDIFKIILKNRPVNNANVRRLVALITAKNLLKARPLDVTTDMGVIDGQHRLAAARELGVPVYYKINPELTKEDIIMLNVAQKNWAPTDYLHSWAVEGRPSYVTLNDFIKRHPLISFSNAKTLLGTTTKHTVEEFRKGEWQVGDVGKAEQVVEFIEWLVVKVPTFKQAIHTGFVNAVYHCVNYTKGFDLKEFMRTILVQPLGMVPCAGHKQYMLMFGTIYNYRKSEVNRLDFV